MAQFTDLIYEKFRRTILSWDTTLANDIYVIEIFCGDNGLSQGDFLLAYNTETYYKSQVAIAGQDDAKWSPSEWLCDYQASTPETVEELSLWVQWCESVGVEIDSELTHSPYNREKRIIYGAASLASACSALGEEIARRLHEEQIIQSKFGRDVPIFIVEGEGIVNVKATLAANPQNNALNEFVEYTKTWLE